MSVLKASEGQGLVKGLQKHFRDANVPAPCLLYVDHNCCGKVTSQMFWSGWPDITIQQDIWHFMRGIAAGVNTVSHQLYSVFMGRLSQAIFAWDQSDLEMPKETKHTEMQAEAILHPTDSAILKRLGHREMSLHCRCVTRGVAETTQLIEHLIATFSGDLGSDTLGIPLLDSTRSPQIWEEQKKKRHVACIQDPPGRSLYTVTGSVCKVGKELIAYWCSRGSTSLEPFHLQLNRFIPGLLIFFSIYMSFMHTTLSCATAVVYDMVEDVNFC